MRYAFSVAIVLLFLCMPQGRISAYSGSQPVRIDAEELETFFDGLIPAEMDAYHLPGGVVSIVQNGTLVFAKGYGYADVAMQKPVVAESTMFRLASLSKLFVWTAVMQLVEQGKLDLDADINIYLNNFKIPTTYPVPVTLLDLMNHTAGFEERALGTSARHLQDIKRLEEFLATQMPARVFPPGEITAYSNYGAALAGYIVGQVSGIPFEDYVQKNILDPLQMEHSTFQQPLFGTLASSLAIGYTYEQGSFSPQDQEWSQLVPAASLSATATDMSNFMIAHLQKGRFENTRILQESTAVTMQQQSFANDPHVNGYAHGFSEATINGQHLIGHTGDIMFYHSGMFLLPEHNMGIFVAFNGADGMVPVLNVLRAVMDRYFPDQNPAPITQNNLNEPAARYEGTYFSTRNEYTTPGKMVRIFQSVNVTAESESQLVVSLGFPAQMTWHYVEISPGVFRSMDVPPSIFGDLVFDQRQPERDQYLFLQNNPGSAYTRAPWYAEPAFNMALVSIVFLLFLSVIAWAPIASWVRRRCPETVPQPARWASWWQGLSGVLILLFLTGFIGIFSNPQTVFGLSPWARVIFLLPLPIAILAVGMIGFTLLSWAQCWWSLPGRLHYTLVSLAGLVFTWWLAYWNLWIGYLY